MREDGSPLFLVRHAKVTVRGVCYGQSDVPTVLEPSEAASRVLVQLRGVAIDAIYTSPWARTEPVARHLSAALGAEVLVDRRLSELSMGRWEGRRFDAIEREEPELYSRWMERWREEGPPGGETLAEFIDRVTSWANEPRRGVALVVTHAGVIRALRAYAEGSTYEAQMSKAVDHLAVERMADRLGGRGDVA